MKKTPYSEFVRQLREKGEYRTAPENRRTPPRKQSAWISFRYFLCNMYMLGSCSFRNVLRRFNHDYWAKTTWHSLLFPEQMGSEVIVTGFQNRCAYSGPVVYLCNHMSTLETMALPPMLIPFGKISIILKKSIDQIPFIGSAMRTVGDIAVTRTNPREDLKTVFREGCDRISRDFSIVIFPQGTRSPVFDRRHFSSLGVKLAEKAKVPVIPIACQTDFLAKGKPGLFEDFGAVDPSKPIRFACGHVLPPELGAKAMQEQSIEFIAGKLTEWGLAVKAE